MRTLLRFSTLLFVMLAFGLAPAHAQIRINEVSYNTDFQGSTRWVELYNAGTAEVPAADYWLCNFPSYSRLGDLTVLDGNLNIPPDGYLVVTFDDLGEGDGMVGLYSSQAFDNADAMLDFMQYGSAGHTRESVAVAAGVWDADTFAEAVESGQTLSYFGAGANSGANWGAGQPTAGAENSTPTAIDDPNEIVETFRLSPAYPNPFNPATQFTLTVAASQHVTLAVYNVLGRHIETLHEGPLAGQQTYQFTFEPAADAPSGLYLIRATGERFTSTERIMLLK